MLDIRMETTVLPLAGKRRGRGARGVSASRPATIMRLRAASLVPYGDYAVVYDDADVSMLHTHEDFDELVFTLSGSAVHMADGVEYPLIRGEVFVLRGTHAHCFKFKRNLRLMNILYRRERFVRLVPEFADLRGFDELFVQEPSGHARRRFTTKLRLDARQMDEMLPIIQAMQDEIERKQPGFNLVAEALFKIMVTRVCRFHTQAESMPSRAVSRVGLAVSFIERNYAGQVTIAALMRVTRMARSTFLRVFKETTGCTPIDYLNHLRIERAAEMLASRDLRVIDAAMNTGFDNSSYFTRKFKAIMGVTPKRYIRLHRTPLS